MIAMGCAVCQKQIYIAHESHLPLPTCEHHPYRAMIDWNYIERYPDDKLLGETVSDQYILIRPLGKGGFGSVYFAIHKQTDAKQDTRKAVAIKFLTRISDELIELFNDEMRLMSQLRNQYIVQLFGSGQHQSPSASKLLPYMVMEFVEGETLSDRLIQRGPLSPQQVILLLKQLLLALIEAHDLGMVHRDLKPLNLMVCYDSDQDFRLVVLDFGISKMLDDATREATRNKIMGTPYYLAPEILLKGELSHHTDLFAAAVIAYESLSYHSPFLNEELSGIEPYLRLRNIYKDQTKPDPLPEHLPKEWTQFFDCALHADPLQRFPDAKSMLMAIEVLEQMTSTVDQEEAEHEVSKDFEDDDETMLFKKQLMRWSDQHLFEDMKTSIADSEARTELPNHDLSEISVLESVSMIDSDLTKDFGKVMTGQRINPYTSLPQLPPSLPSSHPTSLPSSLHHSPVPSVVSMKAASPPPLPQTKQHPAQTAKPKVVLRDHKAQEPEVNTRKIEPKFSISSPDVLTIQVGSASPLLREIKLEERKLGEAVPLQASHSSRQAPQNRKSNRFEQQSIAQHMTQENTQVHKLKQPYDSFIWFQLLIMVGLGIGFAYVVAHYILN